MLAEVSMIRLKAAQNLVSRSCMRYWLSLRNPHCSIVRLWAICFIQPSLGCGVAPAMWTARVSSLMKNKMRDLEASRSEPRETANLKEISVSEFVHHTGLLKYYDRKAA